MPNMRIVADNVVDRATSLTASSSVGALTAANLRVDVKSLVWRAAGTSATLTVAWPNVESIACVALPFCNLSPAATIRVRGAGGQAFDTGAMPACPAAALALRGWGAMAAGVNAFGFGGGAYARIWFPPASVNSLVIDLDDPGNPAGYIEASRLVVGPYWSPTYNANSGAVLTLMDASKHYRTDAGDLMTDLVSRNSKLSLNLMCMPPADRTALTRILHANGMASSVFLSLFPEDADLEMERDHQIYGKVSQMSAINLTQFGAYSSQLEIEEL